MSRLIGAPPGYVGYEEGGQLTEAVRRRPYQVILLDEIEKAHPDVFNVLLQVLDDGRLTDGQGRTVDFKNAVIIMTSNVGVAADQRGRRRGRGQDDGAYEAMKRQVTDALRAQFRPEFLNRIDEIIVFHALSEADLEQIVDLLLDGLELPARRAGPHDRAHARRRGPLIVREGTDPAFGARPLKRTIQRLVENPLARALAQGRVRARRHDQGRRRPGRRARSSSRPSARRSSPRPATGATPDRGRATDDDAEPAPRGRRPAAGEDASSTCPTSTTPKRTATAASSSTLEPVRFDEAADARSAVLPDPLPAAGRRS